ncbi:concanavalin A-like lectin/glucanase, partial [Thozetella sp. PMI_491]
GFPAIPSGFSKILFQDDFSKQQPGLLPSQSKWTIDTGVGYPGNDWGWGNQEQESYTAYTDNLVVTANGTLRITPRHVRSYWYSARIETNAANDFSCPAGGKIRVEASLMLGDAPASQQQGIWPAFWMIGTAFRGNWNNWPGVGEIDLMETVNGQGQVYHNVHCGVYPDGPCNEPNGRGATVTFTRGVFHTVSVDIDRTSADWQSQSLTFRIDGVQTLQLPGSTFQTQDVWESLAATPKMILLNVAVGGNWPGYANDQTVDGLPVAMDVKYVVVYSS